MSLELKLWNHLATHGNLMLSEAWYAEEWQAEMWREMSESEFANPKSNANKETSLLKRLFALKEVQEQYQDSVYVIDVGAGTGRKANELFNMLPTKEIFYLPVDSSNNLLEYAVDSVRERAIADEFEVIERRLSLEHELDPWNQFSECLQNNDYADAFSPTIHLLEALSYKFKQLENSEYVAKLDKYRWDRRVRLDEKILLVKERMAKAKVQADKKLNRLQKSVDKLVQGNASIHQKRSTAMSLREKYDLGSLWIAYEFTTKVEEFLKLRYEQNKEIHQGLEIMHLIPVLADQAHGYVYYLTKHRPIESYDKEKRRIILSKPGMCTDIVQGHFEDLELVLSKHSLIKGTPKLVAFLGNTLGNFDEDYQKTLLKKLSGIMKQGDALLLGVQLAPKKENPRYDALRDEILANYGGLVDGKRDKGPQEFLDMTLALLQIPPNTVEFDAYWKGNHAINMEYTVKDELKIRHPERRGEFLVYQKGKKLLAGRSYKFKLEKLHSMITEAGLKLEYQHDTAESYWVGLARK